MRIQTKRMLTMLLCGVTMVVCVIFVHIAMTVEQFKNPGGVAIMVEPRLHRNLVTVIRNILQHIPDNWVVYLFPSPVNSAFLRSEFSLLISLGKIVVDGTLLGNKTRLNALTYSAVFANASLWNRLPAEKVLVFQVDAIICHNSPRDLTSFLDYDYVGAPWTALTEPRVGNGGFSIRSKKWALEAIRRYPWYGANEDYYFAKATHDMKSYGAKMPTFDEAKQFCVETVYYPTPFAVHSKHYKSFPQRADLEAYCPEILIFKKENNTKSTKQ